MTAQQQYQQALALEKKRYRRLFAINLVVAMCILFALLLSFTDKKQPVADVIRTRGIIIVDAAGRERILMGAPLPASKDRLRDDTAAVRAKWAGRFPNPNQYMQWYQNYYNSAEGIVLLDENGVDRIVLASKVTDPNIGQRIGTAAGLLINDENGFERSGYNIINVGGKNRVVLGLDGQNGSEAVALSVLENGHSGLSVYGQNKPRKNIFIGEAPAGYYTDSAFNGMLIRDKQREYYKIHF